MAASVKGVVSSSFSGLRRSFWRTQAWVRPVVNLEKTRSLYRSSDAKTSLGSGFAKRIINAVPDFMGLPYSSSGDENVDELLNDCFHHFWSAQLQQAVRDACRDTKTIVRLRQHDPNNPLVDDVEFHACYLEVISPDRVEIFYRDDDKTQIQMATVEHEVELVDNLGEISQGKLPQTTIHRVIETITPDGFSFWDETDNTMRDSWGGSNSWGFVPLVEVYNEYESYLDGGVSDLETPLAFVNAFHEVLAQSLQAHKQHAIPKATLTVKDIDRFLMNNFPEAFEQDQTGKPIPGTFNGKVEWRGTEIFFFEPEEGAGFLEAKSVLGDSVSLLNFLLDCAVMSSETPRWVLMLDVAAADKNENLVFINKINRKRVNFSDMFQKLGKMVQVVNGLSPSRVPLAWAEIDPQTLVNISQALQQTTMSLELALERQLISDNTAREFLRRYIPNMKSPAKEAESAKANFVLLGPGNPVNGRVPASAVTAKPTGGANA